MVKYLGEEYSIFALSAKLDIDFRTLHDRILAGRKDEELKLGLVKCLRINGKLLTMKQILSLTGLNGGTAYRMANSHTEEFVKACEYRFMYNGKEHTLKEIAELTDRRPTVLFRRFIKGKRELDLFFK